MRIDFHSIANTDIFGYGQAWLTVQPEFARVATARGHEVADYYSGGDVQIYFAVPFDRCRADFQRKSERFLCFTMWESTVVSEEIRRNLESFDGLIVPSRFCVEVFRANGFTKPIYVAPLGIVPEKWVPIERDPLRVPFRIFWQGQYMYDRKGALSLLRVFHKLNLPQSQLILKMNPKYTKKNNSWNFWMHREWLREDLKRAGYYGRVKRGLWVRSIGWAYSRAQMYALLLDCDLSVYPSRAEGFGLLPLEHMATGLPLVMADNTGMHDYADPEYMKLLPCTERTCTTNPAYGLDYEADEDAMAKAIRWAYKNRLKASQMGMRSAAWVRENWGVARTGQRLVEIAEEFHAL